MAVYNNGIATKQNFILHVYQKLLQDDTENLTVRALSKEVGLSSAALYRHFFSLDYLLIVASIRFLDSYLKDYGVMLRVHSNLFVSYFDGWKLFNHYAFMRPKIFYRLFWGKENKYFADAVTDYFSAFPVSQQDIYPNYFYSMLNCSDITQRDHMILQEANTACPLLTSEQIQYFGRTNSLISKGLLEEAIGQDEAASFRLKQECNQYIWQNLCHIPALDALLHDRL